MTAPALSVVIPTFNRAAVLDRNLRHLEAQDLDRRHFEVIVCDDASTDDTAEVGRRWESSGRLPMRFVAAAKGFAGAARNRGVELAQSDRVLFLGDDILADPNLLSAHVAGAQRLGAEAVLVGHVRYDPTAGLTRFMRFLEDEGVHHDFPRLRELENGPLPGRYLYACNASLPRRAHEAIGGYDESIKRAWEDTEYGIRLERAGFELRYLPDASAAHVHPITLPQYLGFLRRGRDDIARVIAQLRAGGMEIPVPAAHPLLDTLVSDRSVAATAAVVDRVEPVLPERVVRGVYRRVLRYERRQAFLAAFSPGVDA